jgi:NTE family protein
MSVKAQTMGRVPEAAARLREISLFSDFPERALSSLAARCVERAFHKGDVLWRAGDDATELLVVLSGELEVWGTGPDGGQLLLGHIGPGECVGEMGVVLDERRSATVVCSRPTHVLALGRTDFRDAVRTNTRTLVRLTELLARRAMSVASGQATTRTTTVAGVVADPGVRGASLVAAAVADLVAATPGCGALLVRFGDSGIGSDGHLAAAVVTRRGRSSVLDVRLDQPLSGQGLAEVVGSILASIGGAYRAVIVDLPSGPAAAGAAAAVCDDVVQIISPARASSRADSETAATESAELSPRLLRVLNRYPDDHRPPPANRCEPFVLPSDPALRAWNRGECGFPLADPRSPAGRVLQRLTRKLLGATVGVALGGGAAFGIAHVGVLLALEEAGIPVDLVAGTSMGSIVALGYAAGLTPGEMVAIATRIANVPTTLSVLDPSITGTGLLGGRRLVAIFSPLLPVQTFEELLVPCRVVAMDVESGQRVDIGTGRLDAAFRASCSIPIVFTPVRHGDHTLVDGGMLDPVPVDVAREMGADIVIAVNVVPKLEPGVSTVISRAFKRVNRLNPLSYLGGGSRELPDIVDVLMNSLQAMQYELGNFKSLSADVLVNVDIADFTWIEFYRALAIIERGHEAGQRAVPRIRAALNSRLAHR